MAYRLTAFLAFLFVLVPLPAVGQLLSGRAIDAATGESVAGVEIALLAEGGELAGLARSSSSGTFRLQVARAGTYRLVASAAGYDTVMVDSVDLVEEEVTVELRMGPQPFEIEPLTVVARRSMVPMGVREFQLRAERYHKTGWGLVLDREKLAEHPGETTSRVLRRYAGHVEETMASGLSRLVLKRKYSSFDSSPWCDPAFFLDGLPVDGHMIRSLPTSDLDGLEVYRGVSQVPSKYLRAGAATSCGVILAWTRRDS